jgi:tryptophanyl-tRNA synthetase
MSLKDGSKKMSKSDPSDQSRINLLDTADDIARKIKRATSDSEGLPSEVKGLEGRSEASNLVGIYAALAGKTEADVLREFGGKGFGVFKPALADLAVAKLGPVADTMRRLMNDPAEVDRVLMDGAARANAIAQPVMEDVRRVVGFWRP